MTARIPTALVIVITAVITATAVDAGSCSPKKASHCVNTGSGIDLNSVPEITKQIVSEEPAIQTQKKFSIEPPAAAPYTGPIVGVTLGKQTPTVGYSWSLE
jgi:hypothetical protein